MRIVAAVGLKSTFFRFFLWLLYTFLRTAVSVTGRMYWRHTNRIKMHYKSIIVMMLTENETAAARGLLTGESADDVTD